MVSQILDSRDTQSFTARSITEPDALRVELGKLRGQGFACDNREYNDIAICVAAPARNTSGVVAGLSISYPGVSSRHEVTHQMIAAVVNGAAQYFQKTRMGRR
jgi:DNA-binding IclR family transcriptional regulator